MIVVIILNFLCFHHRIAEVFINDRTNIHCVQTAISGGEDLVVDPDLLRSFDVPQEWFYHTMKILFLYVEMMVVKVAINIQIQRLSRLF